MRGSDNGAMFAADSAHATFHCPTRSFEERADRFFSDATFNYVVAAGQNTPDLAVSSFVPNGAIVQNGAGTNANLTVVPPLTAALQIDARVPTPVAIVASGTGITDPITSELAGVLPC
jgi:hypothetical protein